MATVKVPHKLDSTTFARLSQVWDTHDNVSKVVPDDLSAPQLNELMEFLLDTLPNNFAFSVLADLVESYEGMPPKILEKLFKFGNTSCNVSICLSKNLSPELRQLCSTTTDEMVREHFEMAQAKHK